MIRGTKVGIEALILGILTNIGGKFLPFRWHATTDGEVMSFSFVQRSIGFLFGRYSPLDSAVYAVRLKEPP